jgi:hypothetical protein
MNAIILKGAALRQPPLPQSGSRAKTIAHPCTRVNIYLYLHAILKQTEDPNEILNRT